jgi:murein DD-endopeptidase MepM/ murein hydrolase activator NlpD
MPDSSKFEIFRDEGNLYTRIAPRTNLIWGGAVLLGLVLAGNIWWLSATLMKPYYEEELEDFVKSTTLRAQALERVATKTKEAEDGVERLRVGDSSLREMIKLDKGAKHVAQGVGAGGEERLDQIALLNRMEIQAAYIRALNRPVKMKAIDSAPILNILARNPSPMGTAPDAWPAQGIISSEFGVRLSPFAGQEEFHKGVDIMTPAGSPVRSPAPGMVSFAGEDAEGTQAVVLEHGGGYVTTFSHMQRLEVKAGDRVERGQDIGSVGQEGRSTGPHLHYEVRLHGIPVDPKKYLP